MKTLPDYLRAGLRAVSIGLNPSVNSVKAGFYFATPQNRFWKALNASRILDEHLEPGVAAVERLFREYGIGFTDVVKRPSASGSALRAADYRRWAPVLKDRLLEHRPRVAWFHGKLAYTNYLKYAEGSAETVDWGKQPVTIGEAVVFVTPNPSPANAAYSLENLTDWYRKLGRLIV